MIKSCFQILLLLFFGKLSAQESLTKTVYFEFDKYTLYDSQVKAIVDFVEKTDSSKIESIQIYGYCDDRGNNDYNNKLSKNRVNTVKNAITSTGFNKNKIVFFEGKGRVILNKDTVENLTETRSKNRRVDLFIVKKNNLGKDIYDSFQSNHKIGDRISLTSILFALGSSELLPQSKKELDKIATLLQKNKNLQFEIRGHVCCTPNEYTDAIDKATDERKLSLNRARSVYRYLASKNLSRSRMTYKGYGNKDPLGKGDKFDRRVEFVITKT